MSLDEAAEPLSRLLEHFGAQDGVSGPGRCGRSKPKGR